MVKKKGKLSASTLVVILGVSTLYFAPDAQASNSSGYTPIYNNYNKQATNLINSISSTNTKTTAQNLLTKIKNLDTQVERLEDELEAIANTWSHYRLLEKIDALDNRLDDAEDRLEDRFGLDD